MKPSLKRNEIAHESGLIGEDPNGIPNNLVPYIAQVAVGKLAQLQVHGDDYSTPDGTGVRDYIHVVDLAAGHVAALKKLAGNCGLFVCNLGTGKGYSVLEVLKAYERACGHAILRSGPPPRRRRTACYADPAEPVTSWAGRPNTASRRYCASSWKWQSENPNGYGA